MKVDRLRVYYFLITRLLININLNTVECDIKTGSSYLLKSFTENVINRLHVLLLFEFLKYDISWMNFCRRELLVQAGGSRLILRSFTDPRFPCQRALNSIDTSRSRYSSGTKTGHWTLRCRLLGVYSPTFILKHSKFDRT